MDVVESPELVEFTRTMRIVSLEIEDLDSRAYSKYAQPSTHHDDRPRTNDPRPTVPSHDPGAARQICVSHPRCCASRRSRGSGLITRGSPTRSSIGRSE